MTRHHSISNPEARPPTAPSERWHQAFPQGSWSDWPAVRGATANYDMLWVPVTDPNWVNLVNEIVKLAPDTPVIVMSPIPHDTEGLRAINQGARGYCHLYANPALLQEVAHAVQAGSLWVGPELVDRLVAAARSLLDKVETARQPALNATSDSPSEANRPDLSMLSPREREVADQVAMGKTNKEIARTLDITERTVKAHLGAVFEKLAVRDRLQLVLFMSPGTSTRG